MKVALSPPLSPLLSTPAALTETLGGPGRARAVWEVLRRGDDPFSDAGGRVLTRRTRELLAERVAPPAGRVSAEVASTCGTTKLLLTLADGRDVEAVLIPRDRPEGGAPGRAHSTLCVSSQVGCGRACAFCATGAMGLLRSLSADEILQQVHAAVRVATARGLPPVRNIVYMGMGEPADNLYAVSASLEALVDPHGFGLARRHVCVSTVGPSPAAIRALAPLPARLAWSAHAADDELRRALVPTTRHQMSELRDAFGEALVARGTNDHLMVECALIDGVNDAPDHADALAALLAPLPGATRVNLIPYNLNEGLGPYGSTFRPARPEAVAAFQRRILDAGAICTIRTARGDREAAACGQLAAGARRAGRAVSAL
jgi:23S rRNA (adenine2503-C2)-methyltransferase